MKILLAMVLALSLGGCAKHISTAPSAVCQGTANAFDCTTFQTLFTIQAAIEQAKIGVPDSKKALLNKVIDGYNAAEKSYMAYHALALAGTATAEQQAALQTKVTQLKADAAGLSK